MRLSKNFQLEEFLVSGTAERDGIDMTPGDVVTENLQRLVTDGLQPLRDEVGQGIYISSGYRPLALNKLIGGSKTSEHIYGNAADFKVMGQSPFETCELIVAMGLPFDQIIHEFGKWVHWGMRDTLRSQQLTAHRHEGKTRYVPGIIRMEDLT